MVDIVLNIINTIQFLSHVDKNLWDKTKKIDEKVIWITGGSSGIGKAVALKFANKGWQVIISSRREEFKDISDKNENIDYLKLDIVDYEACIQF